MKIDAGLTYYDEINKKIRAAKDCEIEVDNCLGQRYIGCGLSGKNVVVNGTPGNALGAYLNGGNVKVFGNAQDATGDTMNDGKIFIHGSSGDATGYAAQEIKNAIAFIEEHTGEKWDWKAYFECAERVNYATKCRLEWLEMNKTDYPQVFGSNLALYTETNYMAICGKVPAFREVDRKITQLAERAYRKQKKAANEYRHRAIVWGVQSHFYMDFLVWLLNCWGIVPLTDMLSMVSTRELATTDTPENREQAYYDMAWLTENMIMRNRTHGGYKVLLDELWEFCEQFNADMVILWEHMSCKALDGMHGLFEERAREHGIHLVWVTHDLFDPRVISRQGVRQQVNDYMRTVMQEEPVDPSLEILKDEKSW